MPDTPISENCLLASLPSPVLSRLETHLEPVNLDRAEVLFLAREPLRLVYFPASTVVSLVTTLEGGESLEVGVVGRDGLAGIAVTSGISTMPCDGVVQIPGVAYRMSADVLKEELLVNEPLSSTVGKFSQVLLARSMQLTVCNTFHSAEQRCVRWLLTISDLTAQDTIPLTHDVTATMLGVHRPTVTRALRSLHNAGLVAESRGSVAIRDRHGLEAACCECYRMMRDEQQRLLGC